MRADGPGTSLVRSAGLAEPDSTGVPHLLSGQPLERNPGGTPVKFRSAVLAIAGGPARPRTSGTASGTHLAAIGSAGPAHGRAAGGSPVTWLPTNDPWTSPASPKESARWPRSAQDQL